MKRIASASLSVLLIAVIVVGSASAGGSTIVSGYAGKAGATVGQVIGTQVSKPSAPAKTVHTGSTLPFTGMNLTLVALAAIVLIGLGFALTRASRHDAK